MIGTRLAHYEIVEHIGSGGMGDVYAATDSRLGRKVAIKLLPAAFAQDADRVARLQREAQALASLTHPHIAVLHGLEEADGRTFLVMELVERPTLTDIIAGSVSADGQSPRSSAPSASEAWPAAGVGARRSEQPRGIPINDALAIAAQIADALEAAHDRRRARSLIPGGAVGIGSGDDDATLAAGRQRGVRPRGPRRRLPHRVDRPWTGE